MELLDCQLDATLKEIQTTVIECLPSEQGGFDVVLAKSPFYPDGGGQPSDFGTVGGLPVLDLRKDESGRLVHRVPSALAGEVTACIDWQRRYDHMQQHTAQHLLTATALDLFGWKTVAFHLSAQLSDIELNVEQLPESQLQELEDRVNQAIRRALPVSIKVVQAEEMKALAVRSRGLPDGFIGPVRLVEIQGLDLNTCGGTHVANTAELQMVKLMAVQKLSRATRLFFVAGGRTLAWLRGAVQREEHFNRILSTGPDKHVAAVERLLQETRTLESEQRMLRKELAGLIGETLVQSGQPSLLHRTDAGMDFLKAVANAALAKDPKWVGLLAGGEGPGVFLLVGPQDLLNRVGPQVAALLGGRGGGAGGMFQGKAESFDQLPQALKVLAGCKE